MPEIATNVVGVAAGGDYSLCLRADGTVVGWGENTNGQSTGVPTTISPYIATGMVMVAGQPLSNVVQVAAGKEHGLAIRADHTVVGWGKNDSGQASPPAGLSNIIAIAAGDRHSLALRADGRVIGWGDNTDGQTNSPAYATNVVAIAAGDAHSVALRGDGQVLVWGANDQTQTNIPPDLTNVVAIGAAFNFSVALKSDGFVIGWGGLGSEYFMAHTALPSTESNVVAIAAGAEVNLALRADGSVVGWGMYDLDDIPASVTNVVAVESGYYHNLALRADGTVVGWGNDSSGQATVPANATNVVDIAAGDSHSLALRSDGTVVAWGDNSRDKAIVPSIATNVVAVAGGYDHSLALRADGTVVGWGYNSHGEATGVPTTGYPYKASGVVTLDGQPLANVVAITAGGFFSMALRSNGELICWGSFPYDTPAAATNLVAIDAGFYHVLALRSDGKAFAWGGNLDSQTIMPANATNVVAIAAGNNHSLFLTASETHAYSGDGQSFFVREHIPDRIGPLLEQVNAQVLNELDFDLHDPGLEAAGAKALLQAVLELGMPYTMERDDVLHGCFYGSEPLADLEESRTFLQAENAKLTNWPAFGPQSLVEVNVLRYLSFSDRLNERLLDLQATGQPEIPRIVGHTLRLLNLLRDAWTQPTNSPPPTLEMWSESGTPCLLLYGEPYTHYTLQDRVSLGGTVWSATGITNLHNEEIIITPVSSPSRFFRALLPVP